MACTDVQTIQAGNGTKTQFSFDFPYIFKSEIHVYFWNAVTKEYDEKLTTDATYPWQITDANPTIVEFTGTAPPSPATPTDPGEPTVDNVKIRRITKVDDIQALFNPGSAIRSDDLNKNFEQLRYAVQESNCQGISDELDQYLKDYYWDRYDNTLYDGDAWVSDDTKIATTAALDARFQDEVNDTLTKAELAAVNNVIPDDDVAVPTTGTVKDYVDHVVETDILVNSTGLTKTATGGQVTLGIAEGSVDLDRIKPADIIVSGESNPNNNTTIATTAKIDDMIDEAITGDIATDGTGITVTDDGDGTITLGIADNSVDFDKIKDADQIKLADQVGDYAITGSDDKVFTSSAAIRRFENYVQLTSPTPTAGIGKGAVWLQNDDDLTISMWSGSSWVGVASGGTFISQPQVIYVDATAGLDTNDGHRISRPKQSIKAAINDINAGIELSTDTTQGFNGGSGYTNGTYTSVPLTGGTIGSGVTADITVSGGAVTAVTNVSNDLQEYQIGDTLSAADSNLGGGGGSGLVIPIVGDGDGMIVVVSAGVYQEAAPIQIKRRNVSIIGQALRSCIVHPTVATQGDQSAGNHALFELNSGSFIQNLTLTGMKASNSGTNTVDSVLPANQGWNFAFYSGANVTKSPYIQNCTNFSDSEIDNSDLNAFNPRGGSAGDTDSAPTGGGMLIDGSTVYSSSPLRSMVADSYTHVGLNGPGILVTNNGYAQCTSSYAFFNKYHIKALNGGQANLAASTTDFGEKALVADGKSTTAIFTASTTAAAADGATSFTIDAPVADSSWFGSANRPASNMLVTLNSVTYPVLSATANGTGWNVTISRPNPSRKSENLGLNGAVASGSSATFFLRSMIASSGHTMEYVGSGTDYSALPENGGVPNDTDQITELNDGKIWTATTDHNGKFTVGPLEVDQRSGAITIESGSQVTSVVDDPSPQLGGNLDVNGNSITSTSNANIVIDPNGTGTVDVNSSRITNVTDPTGAQDAATKAYVDALSINSISQGNTSATVTDTGTDGNFVVTTEGAERMRINSSGNVGIGTSSPSSLLHLASNAPYLTFEDVDNNQDWQLQATAWFALRNQTTSSELLRVTSSGDVGIGTTSPGRNLVVNNSSGNAFISARSQDTGFAGLLLGDQTSDNSGQISYSNNVDSMQFLTAGSEKMRIDSSGNVGIGTSSPGAALHVNSSSPVVRVQDSDGTNQYSQFFQAGAGTYIENRDNTGAGPIIFRQFDGSAQQEKMRINSSGNVGIGTSSPSATLHVYGTQRLEGGTIIAPLNTSGEGGQIDLKNPDKTTTGATFDISTADTCRIFQLNNNSVMQFGQFGGTGGVIEFRTEGTQRLKIASNGLVGIGTNSPTEKLDIAGDVAIRGGDPQLIFDETDSVTAARLIVSGGDLFVQAGAAGSGATTSSGDMYFTGYNNTNVGAFQVKTGNSFRNIWHSGNDGSGSGLDADTVDGIQGASFLRSDANDTATGTVTFNGAVLIRSALDFADGDVLRMGSSDDWTVTYNSNGWNYINQKQNGIIFQDNGTAKMRLEDSGIFRPETNNTCSLGTSSARWNIVYSYNVRGQSAGTPGVNNTSTGYAVNNGGVGYFSIGSNAALYTNRNSNGTVISLHRSGSQKGNIQVTTSTATYNSASDHRLKENVVAISDGITRLKQLSPSRFNFIEEPSITVDGFIAHEVQAVVPEAVTGTHNQVELWGDNETDELPEGVSVGDPKLDDDGNTIPVMQGMDYGKVTPLLTAALQEAIAKIETLETQNADLLARVTALENA